MTRPRRPPRDPAAEAAALPLIVCRRDTLDRLRAEARRAGLPLGQHIGRLLDQLAAGRQTAETLFPQ